MVEILDSTLREGEQSPEVTFNVDEKLIIADLLDDFGVNIIEAGHPKVSEDVFRSIKLITDQGFKADILAHCRAKKEDIDAAISCNVDWVGIFFCISKERLEQHFKLDFDSAVNQILDTIQYAKDHGLKVRYTPEDTTRTDYESLNKVMKLTEEIRVDRISIADTVGAMTPIKMYNFVKKIKSNLKVDLNVHCHNDLGLATANSLAAIEAGAKLVDVTVNGIGERVGITPLSEICLTLNCLYKIKNNWKLENLIKISDIVSRFSGVKIPENKPIIGKNAFLHKAGLHVSAVMNNPFFYEIFPAELVGHKRDIILDKMTGKHTVKHKLEKMNLKTNDEDIKKVYNYAKLKEKGTVTENEITQIFSNYQNLNIMIQ
jgi:2-isopropylmalate synthase